MEKGMEKGLQKGTQKGKLEDALEMLKDGVAVEKNSEVYRPFSRYDYSVKAITRPHL